MNHPCPEALLDIFASLCAIPHGSGNTRAIADHCETYARERGFAVTRDGHDNLIIRLPATHGMDGRPTVILQGHLDMVCEKVPGCGLDMAREGLRLRRDGDMLYAEGTTLGGDDGIAVAMALYLLDADLPHPPMELVLTSDEEIGMLGAAAMDMSSLEGRLLLNVDSEEEGVLTVACAGGERIDARLPMSLLPVEAPALRVCLSGLAGGHSGVEILGRRNACAELCALLAAAEAPSLRICSLEGGSKDNAIPHTATATVLGCSREALLVAYGSRRESLLSEESGARLDISPAIAERALSEEDSRRALSALTRWPCGVQRMTPGLEDMVETSLNLGILRLDGEGLHASFLVRSSQNAQRDALTARVAEIAREHGGDCLFSGRYPAWEHNPTSRLREVLCEVWEEISGQAPAVVSIHAGLECGVFCGKLPGIDCVSFGPNIRDIHTTRERLDIPSVGRCWALVCKTLARL